MMDDEKVRSYLDKMTVAMAAGDMDLALKYSEKARVLIEMDAHVARVERARRALAELLGGNVRGEPLDPEWIMKRVPELMAEFAEEERS